MNSIENVLKQLADLQVNPKKNIRVIFNGRSYQVVRSYADNFIVKFFRFILFRSTIRASDDLQHLKSFFDHVAVKVEQDCSLKNKYAPLVVEAFKGLKVLHASYSDTSSHSMVKRNDILEAFGIALRVDKGLNALLGINVERLSAPKKELDVSPINPNCQIPLVPFSHIPAALEAFNKEQEVKTLHDLQRVLEPNLSREHVPMGTLLNWVYQHPVLHSNLINRIATWAIGWINKSKRNVNAESLAHFFKKLNLDLSVEWEGKLYAYSEFYKKEIRQEENNDSAFQRELREDVLDKILQKSRQKQEEIQDKFGKGSVIISNSFNRLRTFVTYGINEPFNIIGKVFSDTPQNLKVAAVEKSYTGEFSFRIKNMLGFSDNVDISFKEGAVKDLNEESANQLLLQSLANFMDQKKVILVIQRLAPEDYHQYVNSAEGVNLTREEWCRYLNKRSNNKVERAQLCILNKFFQKSNQRQAETINISGSYGSVNPIALEKRSDILAKNCRKISFRKHSDGNISIHFHIGAVGVNTISQKAMGMGNESHKDWQKDLVTPRKDNRLKSKRERLSHLGRVSDRFSIGESTVVSLYLGDEITLLPELEAFSKNVTYHKEFTSFWRREPSIKVLCPVEVKTNLGEVIALPKAVVIAQFMIDHYLTFVDHSKSVNDQVNALWDMFEKSSIDLSLRFSKEAQEVQEWCQKDRRSPEQNEFIQEIHKALLHYLTRIPIKKGNFG